MQQAQREGLFAPARRALTIGLVLTVTLVAFEALAVVTILPVIKDDLGGLRLYGWVTSAFFLGTLVGIVVAGSESDRRGPGPPYVLGILLFAAGLGIGGPARSPPPPMRPSAAATPRRSAHACSRCCRPPGSSRG